MAPPAAPRGPDGDGVDGGVCCMCGDRGLPHELIRCRSCRVRLQHRYCSDLYPTAAYVRCNWCLREPADGGGGGAHADAKYAHAVGNYKPPEKRVKVAAPSTLDEEERRQSRQPQQAGCSAMSRAAPPMLGRPIKKQKTEERPTVPPPPPPSPGTAKAAVRGSKKPPTQAAGKMAARPGRVKVRRYKLLAEVIINC